MFESVNLQTTEAILTGESEPVDKETEPVKQGNVPLKYP